MVHKCDNGTQGVKNGGIKMDFLPIEAEFNLTFPHKANLLKIVGCGVKG